MADFTYRGYSVPSIFTVIILLVALSGCRSYGGHGSEEATYAQIQQGHQAFEEVLVRRRADINALRQTVSENQDLADFAEQYALMVQGYEALHEEHGEQIANLSPDSDYRDLNHVFGAMIAMHRTMQMQSERLLHYAHSSFLPADTTSSVERPYALIPPYFDRIREGQRELTVNDVIAAARGGSALEDDTQSPEADTASSPAEPLSEGGPVLE